jgi:hypothetical protein
MTRMTPEFTRTVDEIDQIGAVHPDHPAVD